jgi:hypothetical protein
MQTPLQSSFRSDYCVEVLVSRSRKSETNSDEKRDFVDPIFARK